MYNTYFKNKNAYKGLKCPNTSFSHLKLEQSPLER